MTTTQYKKFLQLPQAHKLIFINLAKKEKSFTEKEIHMLKLGHAVHNPATRKAMFEAIN